MTASGPGVPGAPVESSSFAPSGASADESSGEGDGHSTVIDAAVAVPPDAAADATAVDGGSQFIPDPGLPIPDRVTPPAPRQPPSGALTAGIFDDNSSFLFFQGYRDRTLTSQLQGLMPFTLDDHFAAYELTTNGRHAREQLDIALVLDTTGSMGDEISYLQGEFTALTQSISARYPNAAQRWSLVVYRDVGDEYVTKSFPFTETLNTFESQLGQQSAGGGGDFPEAPDQGLQKATELDWRTGNSVARLVFWVADAPHHAENASAMANAVKAAQQSDIHIYPVASSGIDDFTEYTMRETAQLTLGRYVFLTDDSGIGNSHKEPTVPCAYVTTLSDAISRSVDSEMTGEVTPPDPEHLVRMIGALNTEGNCFYGDGYEATPF